VISDIPLICVVGPTAVGKTAFSLELAKAFETEIINVDPVQIYKKLDIGSAKPSKKELEAVKHHLVSLLSPDESINAAKYVKLADPIINDFLENKKKTVILSGGSNLYLKSILYGLPKGLKANEGFREELEKLTNKQLYSKLEVVDKDILGKLHVNDRKRLIRYLEIHKITNSKPSVYLRENQNHLKYNIIVIVLGMDRELLYDRINQRVLEMVDIGLIDEVKSLIDEYGENIDCLKNIGYFETKKHLLGLKTKEELILEISQNTRRFAKRQLTFWRNEPLKLGLKGIDISGLDGIGVNYIDVLKTILPIVNKNANIVDIFINN